MENKLNEFKAEVISLYRNDHFDRAAKVAKDALKLAEKTGEIDHPDVAVILYHLALIYKSQCQFSQAEELLKRSMEISEKIDGILRFTRQAETLVTLADLYRKTDREVEAKDLEIRAVQIMDNIAAWCFKRGENENAEKFFKRSLAIRKRTLGSDHLDVAHSMFNLGLVYQLQGKYNLAEPLYKSALSLHENAHGLNHPDVEQTLNSLAYIYHYHSEFEKAESLYLRSLAIREDVHGSEHPNVAETLNNLANVYNDQFQFDQAEPLYLRSLAIREKALGPDHPDVIKSLCNLAKHYGDHGECAQYVLDQIAYAEMLFKRSLAVMEKALGPDHPDVGDCLERLANVYRLLGKEDAAKVLEIRAAVILNNLAEEYEADGLVEDAVKIRKRSIALN